MLERGFLWLAELLMLVALGCFVRGFRLRKVDLARHIFWGKAGALLVFGALIAIEVMVRLFGWDFPVRSESVLMLHIRVASAALVVLVALVVTGMTRRRAIHVRLYWLLFPLFVLTDVLSFFAFELW